MKVTFYSNFLTHHQLPFCLEMKKKLGDDFKFVSTMKIFQWRLDLGFEDLDSQYDFVVKAYENQEEYNKALELALSSDVVIIGSTTDECIQERLKQDKLTFRYRARIFLFVDGFFKIIFDKEKMKLFYDRHIKYRKNKNLHLLCANAYGPRDFRLLGLYPDKIYKWGYFPKTDYYDMEELLKRKNENSKIEIIWVARFIKWKHPEIVVKLAERLKKQGYHFHIKMLGTGELEEKTKKEIRKKHLEEVLEVVGKVPSDKVKGYMEKANIFIGTSDSKEGWGVVVNEAMNTGCTIVANRRMGSIPFLIQQNESGMMYKTYKELEEEVKTLIKDKELREKLAQNAYQEITKKWTSEIAAKNLLQLFEEILEEKTITIKEGPASKATVDKNRKKSYTTNQENKR